MGEDLGRLYFLYRNRLPLMGQISICCIIVEEHGGRSKKTDGLLPKCP